MHLKYTLEARECNALKVLIQTESPDPAGVFFCVSYSHTSNPHLISNCNQLSMMGKWNLAFDLLF